MEGGEVAQCQEERWLNVRRRGDSIKGERWLNVRRRGGSMLGEVA
jgi:hypothetical protein